MAPLTALLVVQVSIYQTLRTAVRRVASVVAGVLLALGLSAWVGFVLTSPRVQPAEEAIEDLCRTMADLLDRMAAGLGSRSDRLRTELEAGKPDGRPRRRRNRAWRLPHASLQRLPPPWRRLIK